MSLSLLKDLITKILDNPNNSNLSTDANTIDRLIEQITLTEENQEYWNSMQKGMAALLLLEAYRIARDPKQSNAVVNKTKLEAIKLLLPKLDPERYGDKLAIGGAVGVIPVVTVSMSPLSGQLVEQKRKTIQVIDSNPEKQISPKCDFLTFPGADRVAKESPAEVVASTEKKNSFPRIKI